MLRLKGRRLMAIFLAGFFVPQVLAAGFSYRYQDNQGRMHLDYSVPPEFVVNGYEVLNEQGVVVDVVLPKAVLDERSAKLLMESEERHRLELQSARDETLLRYYSSAGDVERVRERKLQEFVTFIETQKANIVSNRKRVADLQAQAAEMELNGQPVSETILQSLDTLEHKITDAEQAVKRKEEEKKRVWMAFEKDIKRLNELLGESGSRPDSNAKAEDGKDS